MLCVGALGVWLDRPGTASCVWLWALAVVLLIDPWAGFAPGFWLSFGAVGLLLFIGSGRLDDAPPARLRDRLVARLRAAGARAMGDHVGLVPATLALFQQVSIVSALANAVAIPVVTLLVVPACLVGIAVPLDAPWHRRARGARAADARPRGAVAAWPAATWVAHAPSTATLLVALAGIVVWLAPRGLPGRSLGAACLLPLALVTPARPAPGAVRLLAIDVGQGLAVVVETATHALLFDTGPRLSDTSDAGARIVVPLLRAMGVRRLDAMVVSHVDADHAGGARAVLDAVPVTTLWSSLAVDHPIVVRASATGTAWRCTDGPAWTWDDVRFTLLHPPLERLTDPARQAQRPLVRAAHRGARRGRAAAGRRRGAQRGGAARHARATRCAPMSSSSRITARARRRRRVPRRRPAIGGDRQRRLSQSLRPSARRRRRALRGARRRGRPHGSRRRASRVDLGAAGRTHSRSASGRGTRATGATRRSRRRERGVRSGVPSHAPRRSDARATRVSRGRPHTRRHDARARQAGPAIHGRRRGRAVARSRRPGLPDAADQARHSVSGRRHARHRRPQHRPARVDVARPADRAGQPAGRHRRARARPDRPRGARRLHDRHLGTVAARARAAPVQEPAVPPDPGLLVSRVLRRDAAGARRRRRPAGAHDRRAGRVREGQSRQAQLRLGRPRQRRAPRGRAVQEGGRHRHRARAVQGQRARDDGPRRRPHPDPVRPAADHAAAGRGRARSARSA